MSLTLVEVPVDAKIVKAGDDEVAAVAGDWIQIRHGNIDSPAVMLQAQCPVGKKWAIHLYVSIDETDV